MSESHVGGLQSSLELLVEKMKCIEIFYDSIGGMVGYQLKSLQLIAEGFEALSGHSVKQQVSSVECWLEMLAHHPPKICHAVYGYGRRQKLAQLKASVLILVKLASLSQRLLICRQRMGER
jgi:hypothetical protein